MHAKVPWNQILRSTAKLLLWIDLLEYIIIIDIYAKV